MATSQRYLPPCLQKESQSFAVFGAFLLLKAAQAAHRPTAYWETWLLNRPNRAVTSSPWHFMLITGTGSAGRTDLVSRNFRRGRVDYSTAFHADSVYTPQMIVNGAAEFVGSDAGRTAREIAKALEQPPAGRVEFKIKRNRRTAASMPTTMWHRVQRKSVLNIAVVERGLTTDVERGENRGRSLKHEKRREGLENRFRLDPVKATGHLSLTLPPDSKPRQMSVILYVQETTSMKIIAAAGAEVPEK